MNFKKRRITKDRLFTHILDEFEDIDGRVAFASSTYHIVETPIFDVRLRRDGIDSAPINTP